MLVGPTTSGKTTCYEILAKMMTQCRLDEIPNELFQAVSFQVMNPKCITMGELYGEVNVFT